MTTWSCPGCHQTIEATAVAVGHECPSRADQLTDWTRTDLPATPTQRKDTQ